MSYLPVADFEENSPQIKALLEARTGATSVFFFVISDTDTSILLIGNVWRITGNLITLKMRVFCCKTNTYFQVI